MSNILKGIFRRVYKKSLRGLRRLQNGLSRGPFRGVKMGYPMAYFGGSSFVGRRLDLSLAFLHSRSCLCECGPVALQIRADKLTNKLACTCVEYVCGRSYCFEVCAFDAKAKFRFVRKCDASQFAFLFHGLLPVAVSVWPCGFYDVRSEAVGFDCAALVAGVGP